MIKRRDRLIRQKMEYEEDMNEQALLERKQMFRLVSLCTTNK